MDFQTTSDQEALIDAVEQILGKHTDLPADGAFHNYDAGLDATLRESGFLDVAREEGMGALEAALIVESVCKSTAVVEVAASAIVAPMALDEPVAGPIALVANPKYAARFLAVARTAIVLDGDGAVVLDLEGVERETVKDSLFAYPIGRFVSPPDLSKGKRLSAEQTEKLKTWWRIAMTVEASGAMQGAVEFTVQYVTDRRQFGRPLGSFQAIQHRLSERTVQAQATRWLAREAAWSGDPAKAAIAATYAQRAIPQVVHDCHQFNGALGVTLEHPLHYWTYRLQALAAELGGGSRQALAAAKYTWGEAA